MNKSEIGRNIRKLRERLGYYSQYSFAEACGFTAAALSQYETGARKPSVEALVKISKVCDVTIDEILNIKNMVVNKDDILFTKRLIKCCGKLTDSDKELILIIIKHLTKQT
jgi:transcriptional regulator with XRE-family HTH domain